MAQPIEKLVLPRLDWYDEKGRIYKDALIENFNAIEAKLNELQALNALEIQLPDFTTITYEDTTLASDPTMIVNLKSFLEITNLVNFPIECQFNGTTCKVSWWGSNYLYHTKEEDVDCNSDNPALFFNPITEEFTSNNGSSIPADSYFIGYYNSGEIIGLHADWAYQDVDILAALANMSHETYSKTFSGVNDGQESENVIKNGRTVLWSTAERHTASYPMTSTDVGRTTR